MRFDLLHVRIGTSNVAIFNADARSRTKHDRQQLLNQLTAEARKANLRVDRAVLVFNQNGQMMTFGDSDLVEFLKRNPIQLNWNYQITV